MSDYQGLVFPNRAEDLRDELFESYRVFLDYWTPLASKLRFRWESLALQRTTNALMIFGGQGSGKTLLADKIRQGFERARAQPDEPHDPTNLWHRITGGSTVDAGLVRSATLNTEILQIEDDPKWVETATKWHASHEGRHCVVIADNAERGYFMQGLLDLSDAELLKMGRSDEALRAAAERFVGLARGALRPSLFVFLTNDDNFALGFCSKVADQHDKLLELEVLPMPTNRDKETVVRVNINRLNRISFWYCLDRAGPESKEAVYAAIRGEETFPGCFASVHDAIAKADRTGRPANKCTLSLVVLTNTDGVPDSVADSIGELRTKRTWRFDAGLLLETYEGGWAVRAIEDERQAGLLESEWMLRVVHVGNRFVAALLADPEREQAKALLDQLGVVHGVGTHDATLDSYCQSIDAALGGLPTTWDTDSIGAFWAKGQARSQDYEGALRALYPMYDQGADGFLAYRPDLVLSPYRVCSVLDAVAPSRDAVNHAIKRQAHVFEFTAIENLSGGAIIDYLKGKLSNYVQVLEQQ